MENETKEKLIPLLNDGVNAFENGDYEISMVKFKDALDIEPSLVHVRTNLGISYIKLRKYELAEKELEMVLEKLPDNFLARYHLAVAYYYNNREKEGLVECQKALELATEPSDSSLATNTMGVIYGFMGEIDKEIEYYQKAIELMPDFVEPYMNLAYAYQKKFNDDEAISYFQKVIEMIPGTQLAKDAEDMIKDLGG